MIRERLPRATIITFWHIPWPNPEAFGICPWREEILEGMLGSSILGFHTQFHCNNFLDTVDRYLEARVDRETFTISLRRRTDRGAPLPDLDRVAARARSQVQPPVAECRERVRERAWARAGRAASASASTGSTTPRASSSASLAIERLLELEPRWIGQVRLRADRGAVALVASTSTRTSTRACAQLAAAHQRALRHAPATSRSCCKIEHHDAGAGVRATTAPPTLCFVSSLHDGMNLVAKEFVAARDDEQGVLILSQFTGAARELAEALIVNPYDIEQCAAALHLALTMPPDEQRDAHAQHAQPGAGVQRLPLGRAHAARRGAHAPPPARAGARARGAARRQAGAGAVTPPLPQAVPGRKAAFFLDIDGTLLDIVVAARRGATPAPPTSSC